MLGNAQHTKVIVVKMAVSAWQHTTYKRHYCQNGTVSAWQHTTVEWQVHSVNTEYVSRSGLTVHWTISPQMHWIPAVHSISELIFHVLSLVITPINLIPMERYSFELFSSTPSFCICSIGNELSLRGLYIPVHSKEIACLSEMVFKIKILCDWLQPLSREDALSIQCWIFWIQLFPVDQNSLCGTVFQSWMLGY